MTLDTKLFVQSQYIKIRNWLFHFHAFVALNKLGCKYFNATEACEAQASIDQVSTFQPVMKAIYGITLSAPRYIAIIHTKAISTVFLITLTTCDKVHT